MDTTLIDRLARRLCQQVMTFPEPPAAFAEPRPVPGKDYLLYLHVPYCVTLCPFCSFHRVRFDAADARSYFDCLRTEIREAGERGFRFDELYVGGGTPTVLPDELFATIELVRQLHPIESISVETNPDDLGKDSVRRLCEVGVDRLSVGVQSFDDELLREMQRLEKYGSGADMQRRLERTRGVFRTLNVDMIFNFPHQSEASVRRDIDILVDAVRADQVSWYPLMPAESTRDTLRRRMGTVDFAREQAFYEVIAGPLLDAGYVRNSAWCFSRHPAMADEYIAHRDEYLGLGSGAFSYVDGALYASTFSIPAYRERVRRGQSGIERHRELSPRERLRYYLLMHLFSGSLDLDTAERYFAGGFRSGLRRELTLLEALGAIAGDDAELTLTEFGCYVWVVLMREFFAAINNLRDEMRRLARSGDTRDAAAGFGNHRLR